MSSVWGKCLFRSLLILRFQGSARVRFNKSSTEKCKTPKHLPYSISSFLKRKQRKAHPGGIQKMILFIVRKRYAQRI